MRYRLPPMLLRNLHSSLEVSSMAATAIFFRTICSPSSTLASLPPLLSHSRSAGLSYSTTSSTPLFGGLFGGSVYHGDGDWMHSRRLGGKVLASQRGYRKVRGRPSARKKEKGKELELDVKICIEEQLPDDTEILDIAELLRLNVPMAMKLAFDGLKDSDHKTRDPTVDDVGQFESVELSILLCHDECIRELNKDWRNEDHATDVLSMSQHMPELKLPMLMLGDIIISVETAARQAEERGHTLVDEIRILMVHGLLHLLGFDHELSDKAEAEMEEEEERLLKSLGWKGKGLIQSASTAEDDESPLPKTPDGRKKAGSLRFYKPKFNYIFCDMDGTLLNSESRISATNANALREASSRGVKVVIATGKTRPAAIALLKMVDLAGRDGIASEYSPGVFIQGLLVYGKQGREIHRRNLDPHVCREAFHYSIKHNIPLIAFSESRCLTLFNHPLVDSLHTVYHEPKAEIMPSVEHLLSGGDVQKVLFLHTAEGVAGTLRPYWEEATTGRASVVQAQPDMLEIVPAGTSKGSGVSMLLDHFGATANEVMAIGDGENDIEMIELASLGIALSNGSEKTKAVANVIGASNDEDGVADAIYRYAF
ncbi:endoribonuclease YBEY, chloroplastic [Cynara cardunculus var. scolymus]|uniref:endoribonuclease YBEY, chloroplastic n=1 Tax=Cynara cardunculus var. scolymus TaxID=59895 RepID=UPI000D62EB67|nr:endoribonuclease YBEY, chloroplastic [Cynara cardunculus var. scolymus]